MAALKSFGAFILLHGAFFLIVMFLILWLFEPERSRKEIATMAVSSVSPFFLLSFAVLALLFVLPSSGRYTLLVTAVDIRLALAFPILWRFFRIDIKLAFIYTVLLLVVAQFSPVFVRALLQLFEGKPGAMGFVVVAAALPVVLWVATRKVTNPAKRMLVRCILLAALIAPTLLVGHGGMAILPAGMVWPFLFQRGVDMGIQVVSLVISLLITTFVLLLAYRSVEKAKIGRQPGGPDPRQV